MTLWSLPISSSYAWCRASQMFRLSLKSISESTATDDNSSSGTTTQKCQRLTRVSCRTLYIPHYFLGTSISNGHHWRRNKHFEVKKDRVPFAEPLNNDAVFDSYASQKTTAVCPASLLYCSCWKTYAMHLIAGRRSSLNARFLLVSQAILTMECVWCYPRRQWAWKYKIMVVRV